MQKPRRTRSAQEVLVEMSRENTKGSSSQGNLDGVLSSRKETCYSKEA